MTAEIIMDSLFLGEEKDPSFDSGCCVAEDCGDNRGVWKHMDDRGSCIAEDGDNRSIWRQMTEIHDNSLAVCHRRKDQWERRGILRERSDQVFYIVA